MSSYEDKIINLLKKDKIKFEREKTFKDLRHGLYRFDFYLTELNILIECDGEFHFKPIRGRQALLKQQEADRRKNAYCLARGIPLYRIPFWELSFITHANQFFSSKYLVCNKFFNDILWREHQRNRDV